MPGSHLVCDVDRDLAEVGVSMAPAETARRAAGGPLDTWEDSEGVLWGTCAGIWIAIIGRDIEFEGWGSGGETVCSSSFRRLKDGMPNLLSREPPRPPVPGGGGKDVLAGGSGDGR
jgi:hypothetical protein